jgi:regulator of ribonuclease activity A
MSTKPIADLCDDHADLAVCEPLFQDFGGRAVFSGTIATLKVFEDNQLVRETLQTEGKGRVLVIDGGGSKRCALVGGNLGKLAEDNGWAGIVVFGCVRDVAELEQAQVGIRALAAHLKKSVKGQHTGVADTPVTFAGVLFKPGAWLAADRDGMVVADGPL